MAAEVSSPFLCSYQDIRTDEEEFGMTQSRCPVRIPRLSMFPGEKVMWEASPTTHNQLAAFRSLRMIPVPEWCEQTHLGRDMSGLELQQTISPPLDEQCIFGISPEHNENDFYYLNTGNPSPQANYLRSQDIYSDKVFEEDSIMFDNTNYSDLDKEMKTWLPSLSETTEFAQPTSLARNRDLLPHTCTESSFASSLTIKEEKKPSIVRSRHLSIFDSEEPLIKEEPDLFTTGFGECEMKYELEVAAEEEVVTEEVISSPQSQNCVSQLKSEWFDSSKLEYCKEEPKEEPASPVSSMGNPDYLLEVSDDFPSSQELNVDWSAGPLLPPSASRLHLDIGAAMVDSSKLFGESLVDTPEVLKPVLKPFGEFDLISFLLANGDSNNNNSVLPTTTIETSNKPQPNSLLERRRGKGRLTIQELRASQLSDNEKPSKSSDSDPLIERLACESVSSSSPSTSSRPRRESASRFNKRLEEGFFQDIPAVSSDDEDFSPKSKRKRTISSSSSRKHPNYDSDISSISDSYQKYRERRDRNNISSKLSRQKRKISQQKKMLELKELERRNLRLRKKEKKLSVALERVDNALKEYLTKINYNT